MRFAIFVLGLALSASAGAQDDDTQMVHVDGLKNPQMRAYRAVSAGLDMFDRQHALAPAAPEVRFRILSRNNEPAHEPGLALRIASDDQSAPVPISADGMFSVPRLAWAYDEKADLMFNWKTGAYRLEPDVRTPGLPDNARRLGDLRLQCKVSLAIAKEEIPFWVVAMVNTLLLSTDWCMTTLKDAKFSFPSLGPLTGATLTYGDRSLKLSTSRASYTVPIPDRSWPDDALVKLEFAAQ
jgi:hypothetical protein